MRFLLALAVVVVATHRPADACSVVRTYIAPTNYELVATTPRIVIAKAISEHKPKKGDEDDYAIEVEVVRSIKGDAKAGEKLFVRGSTMRYLGRSAKNDFSKARKGAYAGSCTAWDYALGKQYLLFLDQYAGRWDTRGTPFTRVNEEVDAKDEPWTTAVEAYAKIAALPKLEERKKEFDALVAKGVAKNATATDKAIAEDVKAHLAAPTPNKSFAELDAMYRAVPEEQRGRVVMAIGTGGDQAAKGFMKELVQSLKSGTPAVESRVALVSIGAYYTKVSDPPTLALIADLYVALGTKSKQERWDVMWLLIKRADASHQGVMERALAGADDEEAGRLVEWFVKSPSDASKKEFRKRVGSDYPGKYEMALGLAGMGDKDVIAWAAKEFAAKVDADRRWVAMYAIAASPLPEADAIVPKIIAKGGKDLESLVQGYAKARHPKADARLAEISKLKLPAETKKWVDRSITERKNPSE